MIKKGSLLDIIFMMLLIIILIFPNESISAAKSGLLLWFNVIIPTLFPFILISYIIINSSLIDIISKYFSPVISFLFGLSGYAGYAFIMGSISGYPMGGKIIADLLEQKKISLEEAQYMLTFCNNPSPMFVIGFIATGLLESPYLALPMLLAIHLGNIITALLFKKIYKVHKNKKCIYDSPKTTKSFSFNYFDDCLSYTSEILVKIGGYIIFFSLPISLFLKIPCENLPYYFSLSTLELSNGAHLLSSINISIYAKFSLLSSLTAFGSFSVVGQTASIVRGNSLCMKKYITSKIINAAITLITAFIIINLLY